MIVEHLVVGVFMENSWVAACEETREAVLIDPGAEPERIAALLERLDLTPVRIINTHAHLDHVGAVEPLRQRYGIPFAVHEGERDNLETLDRHAAVFGLPAPPKPEVDHWIQPRDVFTFGGESLGVLLTPGHTPGGVSFTAADRVFVGDTLFQESVGRTDLPGGDFPLLYKSIRDGLFMLPAETIAHSGHGPDTTIGHEKAGNPFVGDGADPAMFGLL
jgi:glyoxylase-like metal-dependent hydrolase (beta-lactamase superfamily II)